MRKQLTLSFLLVVFCLGIGFAKPTGNLPFDDSAIVGTWAGTWTGGSTGKFEMTIKKDADGKLSGTLTAQPDQGDGYTTSFKSVAVSGAKLTAKFDSPEGDAEGSLEGTLDGKTLKGSYIIKEKAQGSEVETGNWTTTKK